MSFSKAARAFTLNNGNKIPWVGYGTGTALFQRAANKHVVQALETEFTHIDSAEAYGNEDTVGQGVKEHLKATGKPRSSVFITTKLNTHHDGRSVREHLVESLRKLNLDYLDLYLVHSPLPVEGRLGRIWKEFEEVQKEGLAKNIGVSNFRIKDFEQFIHDATIVPAVNQIEFNPYLIKASIPLLDYHKRHGILTTSWGGLTPLSSVKSKDIDTVLSSIIERLSKESGKAVTDTQVLIKWQLAHNVLPITTSSEKSRLVNLIETLEVPDLTAEEVEAIDKAGASIHYRKYLQHMDE